MGKATIISDNGAGSYTIQPGWNTTVAVARIAALTAENTAIDTRLGTIATEIVTAEFDYNYATDVLSAAITNQAPAAEIEAKQRDLFTKQSEWQGLKQTESFLQLKKTANTKKIEFIQQMTATPSQVQAWCADYTEGAIGEVGTVEIGRTDTHPIIKPGWAEGTAHTALTDGQLVSPISSSPAATFYNYAMLPGAAKWMPRYRTGTAGTINTGADTMDVTLDALVVAGINCNQAASLTNVPVEYMSCNSKVFLTGDAVLIEYSGAPLTAKVVGFVTNPRKCDIYKAYFATPTVWQGTVGYPAPEYTHGRIAYDDGVYGLEAHIGHDLQTTSPQGYQHWIDWRGLGSVLVYPGPSSRYGAINIRRQTIEGRTSHWADSSGTDSFGYWGGIRRIGPAWLFIDGAKFVCNTPLVQKQTNLGSYYFDGNSRTILGACLRIINGVKHIVVVNGPSDRFSTRGQRYVPVDPAEPVRTLYSDPYRADSHIDAYVFIAPFNYTSAQLETARQDGNSIEITAWTLAAEIPWGFWTTATNPFFDGVSTTGHTRWNVSPYAARQSDTVDHPMWSIKSMAFFSQDGSKYVQRVGTTTTFHEVFFNADMTLDRVEFIEGRYYGGIQRRSTFGPLSSGGTPSDAEDPANYPFNWHRKENNIVWDDPVLPTMAQEMSSSLVPSTPRSGNALGFDYVNNVLTGVFAEQTASVSWSTVDDITTGTGDMKAFFANAAGVTYEAFHARSTVSEDTGVFTGTTSFLLGGATAYTAANYQDLGGMGWDGTRTSEDRSGVQVGLFNTVKYHIYLNSDTSGSIPPRESMSQRGRAGYLWADIRYGVLVYDYLYRNGASDDASHTNYYGLCVSKKGTTVYSKGISTGGVPNEVYPVDHADAYSNYNFQGSPSSTPYVKNLAPLLGACPLYYQSIGTQTLLFPLEDFDSRRVATWHYQEPDRGDFDFDHSTFVYWTDTAYRLNGGDGGEYFFPEIQARSFIVATNETEDVIGNIVGIGHPTPANQSSTPPTFASGIRPVGKDLVGVSGTNGLPDNGYVYGPTFLLENSTARVNSGNVLPEINTLLGGHDVGLNYRDFILFAQFA